MRKVTLRIELRVPRSPIKRVRELLAYARAEMEAGRLRRAAEFCQTACEIARSPEVPRYLADMARAAWDATRDMAEEASAE